MGKDEDQRLASVICPSVPANDLTIGYSNWKAAASTQARQARASGENLNYATLAPQAIQVVKF